MAGTVAGPDGTPFPRRNPNRWQEAQWEFRRRYAAEPQSLRRTPVVFRWWTVRQKIYRAPGIVAVLWAVEFLARLVRNTTEGKFIALYRPDDPPGTAPFLCFEYFGDPPGPAETGEGVGTVVGEPVANGTLLLETEGRVILPLWNPNTEMQRVPLR